LVPSAPFAALLRRSADGLAQQFLTSLAKLKAAKDCVLGLAATLSLWLLASEDANPCYFASVAAAVLVEQLLQVRQCCLSDACWVPAGQHRVPAGCLLGIIELPRHLKQQQQHIPPNCMQEQP